MAKEFDEKFNWKPITRYPMVWLFSPNALAFSADNKWMAGVRNVKGEDRICVWERASGNIRFTDAQPGGGGNVVFSPDGKIVVSTNSWTVDLWDVNAGRSLLSDEGHHFRIDNFTLSSDGSTVATNGMDGGATNTVRLWDVKTGKERQRFEARESALAFSRDGKYLLGIQTPNLGNSFVLWDIATKKEKRVQLPASQDLLKHGIKNQFLRDGVFSPDGKTVAISVDNSPIYHFVDVATGKETHSPCGLGTVVVGLWGTCCWSADGRHFAGPYYAPAKEYMVGVWDMTQPEPRLVSEIKLGQQPPENLAYSADGKLLAWSNHTHQVHVWDLTATRELKTFKERGRLAFSPDGRYLVAGKSLHPFDGKSPPLQLPVWPAQMTFGPDGMTLVVLPTDLEQGLLLFDLRKLKD